MTRYSTETVDMFAGIDLDTPRYVPKAGGQFDLITSAPHTPDEPPTAAPEPRPEPTPSDEEGEGPRAIVGPSDITAKYLFGERPEPDDDDDYPRINYGPDLELPLFVEWPEPGPQPDIYDHAALARWLVLIEYRKRWHWERGPMRVSPYHSPFTRAYGLKWRSAVKHLRHILPETYSFAPAYRKAHPFAERFTLPQAVEGARKVLAGEELPPRGRADTYTLKQAGGDHEGGGIAWSWIQRQTHPMCLDIIDRVARVEVDELVSGERHCLLAHKGGFDAHRTPEEKAEEWGLSGGRAPNTPIPPDPSAWAIARFDRDDYRGRARRQRLIYHLQRAKSGDDRYDMVRRFLCAHGGHNKNGWARTEVRYWRARGHRLTASISWGVPNEQYMNEPKQWKGLTVHWGRQEGTWKPLVKLGTKEVVRRWAAYRGIDMNPDQGSLF